MNNPQTRTKSVYEDATVVKNYVRKHAKNPSAFAIINDFAKLIKGTKVLDLGCGPGQDSYYFASKGYTVTGIDYSSSMINAATSLQNITNRPSFKILDMHDTALYFEKNYFDAVWCMASIFHIREEEMPKLLRDLNALLKPNGVLFVGLKAGNQGKTIVHDADKYEKPIDREFVFWEQKNFEKILKEAGFEIIKVEKEIKGVTGTKPTGWLRFFAKKTL